MRALVVLAMAAGVLLCFAGITSPPSMGGRKQARRSTAELLGFTGGLRPGTIGSSMSLFAVAGVMVSGITTSSAAGLVAACAAGYLPLGRARASIIRRKRAQREEWPDVIASLIAAIRSGTSLPEACVGVAGRTGPGLSAAFEGFVVAYRAGGNFVASLRHLQDDLSDPVADRVVLSLITAHEVGGGDLVRVLRTLGDFVREDLRVRKEIEARWSWTVTAARVAAAAPWVVLLLMSTRPEAASAYGSPTGSVTIIVGALATLFGYRAMIMIARLPDERRVGR